MKTVFGQKSTLTMALVFLLPFLGAILFVAGNYISSWLTLDSCLDSGGRWNYEGDYCELSDEEVLRHANEDFNLVVNGKLPKHSKFNPSVGVPADGGTAYYKHQGYKLELRKSIAHTKEDGYMYGPSIIFDKIIENGKPKEMSDIKFYKDEDLKKLLNK